MTDRIRVCVAYGTSEQQALIELSVAKGTTVAEAIGLSGITQRFPQIEFQHARVGIFSQLTTPDALLSEGDRVEIYRPLLVDPKEARRRRASRK